MSSSTPVSQAPFELRWGIIGTGLIASWFVSDLVLDPATHRNESQIKHTVQAIGSSSIAKATAFCEKVLPKQSATPSLYESYEGVYSDAAVDVVYIATPHALHFKNAMDAISAKKHVLCEKPMTVTAAESKKLVATATENGVFLMEAVWTRFFPLSLALQHHLHTLHSIGAPTRLTCDFSLDMPLSAQPASSRLADPALGAGALLDIGIYTLTWAAMLLRPSPGELTTDADTTISSSMLFKRGVDESTAILLTQQNKAEAESPATQAILSASYAYKSAPAFARIEGTEGNITIEGVAASKPTKFTLRRKGEEDKVFDFDFEGWGFFYEADAVARDIRAGRRDNEIMPLAETLRMMGIMDEVRRQNGLVYPQDAEA